MQTLVRIARAARAARFPSLPLAPVARATLALGALLAPGLPAWAGGTLTPKGASAPLVTLDHDVRVTVHDGFAHTTVEQTFFNAGEADVEAVYVFPVPKGASLSEMTIFAGEEELHGEVVAKEKARRAYKEKRDSGEDAGLAEKDPFETFRFHVARVPAQAETRFRFVYYQKLALDAGVGRFVYPQEAGGTDELSLSFWNTDQEVRRSFTFRLELVSAWPIDDVRVPGFEAAAQAQRIDEGRWTIAIDVPNGYVLDRDLVVYYRLADDLPGRMELVPQRANPDAPGTFALTLTPGVDLRPLERGADYVFVLDVSGSMEGKLATLAEGVVKTLGELRPEDRFRIVLFSQRARELGGGLRSATPQNVARAIDEVRGIGIEGGTNLHRGLRLALRHLDEDRVTSLVLVTDAVANQGVVDPRRFHELMKQVDVRVFGFLLGNNANDELMRTIADASGGFYAGVSNADDVVGQVLLAKNKVTHEALHDVRLRFDGVRVHDVSTLRSKLYRGEQLVLFGRYAEPGPLEVRLEATVSGRQQVYTASTVLPAMVDDFPELERLWAFDRIEELEQAAIRGELPERESKDAIAGLGVAYQLVTDETSMLVLDDASFAELGIDRANRARTARERQAQAKRVGQVAPNFRIDSAESPAFPSAAPRPRTGGGALAPSTAIALVAFVALGNRRRKRSSSATRTFRED